MTDRKTAEENEGGQRNKAQFDNKTVKDLTPRGAENVKGGIPKSDNGDGVKGFENMPK